MKSITVTITALLLLVGGLAAQSSGDLTPTVLDELARSCPDDTRLKAAQNALAQVDGKTIMQNWEATVSVDTFFSLRLKDQRITDQKGTGRCWMFSGLNILRPIVAKALGCDEIELSQSYLYFYEKLERANLYLNAVIATKDKPSTDRTVEFLLTSNVQDGENWHGFVALVSKYGVVPQEVMPETHSSSNSTHVIAVLSRKLKQAAVRIRHESSPERIAEIKMQALKDMYRILAMNFGLPPTTFTWRYRKTDTTLATLEGYTPMWFFRETVGAALAEYYPLYSIPTLAFDKKYEIDMDRIVDDGPNLYFVNCPVETLKELTRNSLLDSQAVWFGCDVGQQMNSKNGLMIPGLIDYASFYDMDFSLTRQELFETYSCSPNHNMVFTGVDIVDGRVRKWLVENSWGGASGKGGYLVMRDDWFDLYVQEVVLRKKYIPKKILALFDTKAETLPPWDPMVQALRRQ